MNNMNTDEDHYDKKLVGFLDAVKSCDLVQLITDFRINEPKLFLEFRDEILRTSNFRTKL
jgi:hypothetical protein